MANKVKITLVRSRIKADTRQGKTLDGLSLRGINSFSELEDTPAVRGMIGKVLHLVTVEKV
ncbi:MAG: large subunit ribosomal protein L30 [Myxococcota bacterium]|jgi:large subunit ribosomal protein L30